MLDLSRLNQVAGELAASLAQAIVLPFAGWRRITGRRKQQAVQLKGEDPIELRTPAGRLVAIGGGDIGDDIVVKLIHLAGGRAARISIVTAGSRKPVESFERYRRYFTRFGAERVAPVLIRERAEARDPQLVEQLEESALIFLGGGSQSRLMQLMGGTSAETAVHQVYYRGGVVAGTSAGASIMGKYMPIGTTTAQSGEQTRVDRNRELLFSPGLGRGFGLTPDLIIDQHFVERARFGRLIYAVPRLIEDNEDVLGIGLAESTAVVVHPSGRLEFVGESIALVVDGRNLSHSSLAMAEQTEPLSVFDLSIHVMRAEQWFDLKTRRPLAATSVSATDFITHA